MSNLSNRTDNMLSDEQTLDDTLPKLLKHAQVREGAPEDVKKRIKHNVHVKWQQQTQNKQRKSFWVIFAPVAAACSVAVVFAFNFLMVSTSTPLNNLSLDRVQGEVAFTLDGQAYDGDNLLVPGLTVETGTDGYASIAFRSGGDIRLNVDTRLVVNSNNTMTLEQGNIYFDSGSGFNGRTKLTLNTAHGEITNIGTQFSVNSAEDSLQILVREGQVNLDDGNQSKVVDQGQKLTTAGGSTVTSEVSPTDPVWNWVLTAGPNFTLEGQNLHQFLIWVTRENGLKLEFDSAETKNMAHLVTLHGDIANLSLVDALETVFATVDFQFEIKQEKVFVYR